MRAEAAEASTCEVRLESILGAVICDSVGERVGRLQEVIAEWSGPELVVTEYHLGPAAALERVMNFAGELPVFRILRRFGGRRYKVRWEQLDLSDAERPRLTVPREQLAAFGVDE